MMLHSLAGFFAW